MSLSGFAGNSIRALPGLRRLLEIKAVHGREIGHFSGMYDSSEEALRAAPAAMRSSWNDEALVENGIPAFSSVHVFDWPVLYYLQQRIRERKLNVVTDFGGHVGVKHTAYSQIIDFPEDLRWQVVDVPAVLKAARERTSAGPQPLRFFERLEDTAACEVLLCSGSLQYAGATVEELVGRMPHKPPTILLNKVPVSKRRAFFTVERYIKSLAYRVFGPGELNESRIRLGYTLTARWTIPHRDILVLHSRGVEHVEMVGETWTLAPSDAN